MTQPSIDFTQTRRQQFLTQDYYEKNQILIQKNIQWLHQQNWEKESDQYNCGEGSRWYQISRMTWELLQLEYTAGKPIEQLTDYLEQVVAARENQARAKAEYFKTDLDWVIGGNDESYLLPLQLIGLAYLLNRQDLLPRLKTLIEGKGKLFREIEDTTYIALLRFNDTSISMNNKAWNSDYTDLDNALYEGNSPAEALSDLTAYLKEWYLLHEDHLWHDAHLDLEHNDKYVGYWAFEAAAVVYLLGLDDSGLHQFLYYPKDLVDYARTHPSQSTTAPPSRYTGRTLRVGETCTHSGWYEALHLNNRIERFAAGQIITGESHSPQGNLITWYELTPEAAQEHNPHA